MRFAPNRRWIAGEFMVTLAIWAYALVNVLFTEQLHEPQWQGRAFWSSLPVLPLLLLPLSRLPKMFFLKTILSLEGDRLVSRASMWRDFECRLSEIQEVQSIEYGRSIAFHFTNLKTVDNKKHGIMNRFIDKRYASDIRAHIRAAVDV